MARSVARAASQLGAVVGSAGAARDTTGPTVRTPVSAAP